MADHHVARHHIGHPEKADPVRIVDRAGDVFHETICHDDIPARVGVIGVIKHIDWRERRRGKKRQNDGRSVAAPSAGKGDRGEGLEVRSGRGDPHRHHAAVAHRGHRLRTRTRVVGHIADRDRRGRRVARAAIGHGNAGDTKRVTIERRKDHAHHGVADKIVGPILAGEEVGDAGIPHRHTGHLRPRDACSHGAVVGYSADRIAGTGRA